MRARGVTLIELTVAIAIIAVMFAAVVLGVGALTGARAKEASTELAGVIRNLYDTAALTGKTCRLVFEIAGPKDEDAVTTWRAECAKSGITAAAKRDDELKAAGEAKRRGRDKLADDSRFQRVDRDGAPSLQELQAREKNRVDDASKFAALETEEIGQRQLPSNVSIEVWTAKQREKVSSGIAYMYFFPQGFTERAQVWVGQGSNVWTLTVSPLTGKTVIHGEKLEVPRS